MVGAAHVPLVMMGTIRLNLIRYLRQERLLAGLQSHITLSMVLDVAERPLQMILRGVGLQRLMLCAHFISILIRENVQLIFKG